MNINGRREQLKKAMEGLDMRKVEHIWPPWWVVFLLLALACGWAAVFVAKLAPRPNDIEMPNVAAAATPGRSYAAELVRVVDGDTVDVRAELGMDVWIVVRCRLARIDAPELPTAAGKDSKRALGDALGGARSVRILNADRKDRYGRRIAEVEYDGKNASDMLLSAGLAKPYEE